MSLAAKLLLTPLLIAQALQTRRLLPRLPEADGEREAVLGNGRPFSLLIAGDSSAAGVGVFSQREALAGQLVEQLAAAGLRVHWRLVARTGLTSAQTFALLRETELPHFDYAVLVTGVNDIVDQVPSHRAVAAREALANWLRNRLGVMHVAFAPLPPVHRFPGLPQPLRWVAGRDALRHDQALDAWAATRSDVSRVPMALALDAGGMAVDGFHPGKPVYRESATAIARHIVSQLARAGWTVSTEGSPHDEHAAPNAEGPHALRHRRQPRHRAGDRAARGGRRRQHRAGGQDHRTEPQAARHAVQRR
jgi:lysophospholipase L1-like esterase